MKYILNYYVLWVYTERMQSASVHCPQGVSVTGEDCNAIQAQVSSTVLLCTSPPQEAWYTGGGI